MSAMSKEVIALYITAFLCFIVPMFPTVLSTPINKQPITINAPPCGNYGQGNCITNGPPVNPHKNNCNKANYCRNGKWLAPSESISQAPISMAPKALQHHALLQLAFLWLLAFLVFLELNLRFDTDELVCKDALLKAKNLEKKGKSDISCQSTGSHGGEQAAEKCMPKANQDDKLCARNRRCNARSQSMGPSTASQRGGDKEKNENKRHCLRRQPARLRSQGQEPTAENLFEIDDVQFAASQQQGHKMVVVEADGNYVQPFAVDDLDIFSGESYSVLLRTDQSPSNNYWISVGVRGREPKTPQGLTILNYFPTSASKLPTSQPPVTPRWNDYNHSKAFTESIFALMGSPQPPKTHHRRIILLNTQNRINGVIKWSINNISLVLPATPYLGSMKYGLNNAFDQRRPPDNYDSSYDVFKPPVNPTSTHGSGVYTINFNTTVDVILQNANALANNVSEIHPWHLHGHDFWVLGYGEGKFREEDEKKFNLKNPPLRNTAVIFPYGWTALRFVADNPGVWAFHCHIEPHLHMGMGVVFAEGVHRVGKIPSAALACGLTGNKLN